MTILWFALGAAAAVLIAAVVYITGSPMPVVRMLRKGGDAPASWPAGMERAAEQVEALRDLEYPSEYGRNRYDLYLPRKRSGRLPILLWVHGGAFVAGDKRGVENWAVCLAVRGFAVAAVEYQWAPEARWPAQVKQIGECFQALEKQADRLGLDTGRVVIAGDSAGAHMAAQFALIHTSPSFRQATGLTAVLRKGALRAALLYCGPYDIGRMAQPKGWFLRLAMHRVGWSYLGKRRWQGSPEARATVIRDFITPEFPPVYITDGNSGSFESQGRDLAEALKRAGVHTVSRFFDSGEIGHEYQFDLEKPEAGTCLEETAAFLEGLTGRG